MSKDDVFGGTMSKDAAWWKARIDNTIANNVGRPLRTSDLARMGVDCTAFFAKHVNECLACNGAYLATFAGDPRDTAAVLKADWCFIGRVCIEMIQDEAIRKGATPPATPPTTPEGK